MVLRVECRAAKSFWWMSSFKAMRRRHRIYAIVDDQSNASMITTDLTDLLGPQGTKEKYILSTCSSEKEVKYGRRFPGLVLCSVTGKVS